MEIDGLTEKDVVSWRSIDRSKDRQLTVAQLWYIDRQINRWTERLIASFIEIDRQIDRSDRN